MMPAQEAAPNYARPLQKRGIFTVIGIMFFFVAAGAICIFAALYTDTSIVLRSLQLLMAALFLALPAWIAFTVCRRKLKTGLYFLPLEERRALYLKSVTRQASPRYQKLSRIFYRILILFWAGIGIFWIKVALHKSANNAHAWGWAAYWVILYTFNIARMVRVIRKPPSGINSQNLPEEPQFDASNKPESSTS